MPYQSIVLVKQVPDTRNVTGEVMTKDGTMNRSALPAIFNPEDLNALEMALDFKDRYGGTCDGREHGTFAGRRGAARFALPRRDQVILLSDRKFAGADTQATSYTLKCAIDKVGAYDLVFCGRQAIDGDTAQVGPQVAEKLGVPQITYAESIIEAEGGIVVQRAFDLGTEMVKCTLPCLLTVVGSANQPRPASARKRIEYKLAAVTAEYPRLLQKWPEFGNEAVLEKHLAEHNLKITVWSAADLNVDESQLGLAGSPTQVHKVSYVVLETTESKDIPATPEGIQALIEELIKEYIVG